MALRTLAPPAGTLQAIGRRLATLAAREGLRLPGLSSAAALRLAAPHPVFNLAQARVGAPHGQEYATLTGWRFFLVTPGEAIGSVEAEARTRFDRPRFARISAGPMVRCAARGLALAERSPAVRAGDYVLGMLRLPPLHVHALWLRDGRGRPARDLFIPLEPGPSALAPGRIMDCAEFMGALAAASDAAGPRANLLARRA